MKTPHRIAVLDIPTNNHYVISTEGVVTNVTKLKELRCTTISQLNRYVKVHLDKFYTLHRLVATAFIPNPNNLLEINHIDGNRYNNNCDNLEWCTASQNVQHSYDIGLIDNIGENNPQSKLTVQDVKNIWALKDTNLTARQIRDRLNLYVGVATVKSVRQGKNWRSVTSKL